MSRTSTPLAEESRSFETPRALISAKNMEFGDLRRGHGLSTRNEIRLAADDRVFILSFFHPVRLGPGWDYEAEIVRQSGQTTIPRSRIVPSDTLGNFSLICQAAAVPDGLYELRVYESGTDTQSPTLRISFLVRR
jgi:hypothetical protein